LQAIVPTLAVPVMPILGKTADMYEMFRDFPKYPWVLEIFLYESLGDLLKSLKEKIIEPAELRAKELEKMKLIR
jgi:hypothetical protein